MAQPTIKPGDVLLQSVRSWTAFLIEQEEKTDYSHTGIVVYDTNHKPLVAQALGEVRFVTLNQFISQSRKNTNILVRRFYEFEQLTAEESYQLNMQLYNYFNNKLSGNPFDSDFLWGNYDENGNKKLYCSELIYIITKPFLANNLAPKPMTFDKNREYWKQFFNGTPPDGKPGISPADYENSDLLYDIGHIKNRHKMTSPETLY